MVKMIDKTAKKTQIYLENNFEFNQFWFDFKDKQVLPYIDSFYYTIGTSDDTSIDSTYIPFLDFIKSVSWSSPLVDTPYCPFWCDTPFYIGNLKAPGGYSLHLFVPDCYDVFISSGTPTQETPFIQVQLRSTFLWLEGVENAIIQSRKAVYDVLEMFDFDMSNVYSHINRIDYCFHTNYIQKPYKFFSPENIARMQCSRFKDSMAHIEYVDGYKHQVDFYSFGNRGNPIYLRMYLKSKEVVECGYKNKKCFFISVWKQKKLISEYDAYILTHAYIKSNWNYVDYARLEFYLEYGKNEENKKQCKQLLDAQVKDWFAIRSLANLLTPRLRLVCNIEFQCLRKFFKSAQLPELDKDEIINTYRCTDIISDYLTSHVFKFVDFKPEQKQYDVTNKCKCPVIPLWKLIQSSRYNPDLKVDVPLVRQYSSQTNISMLKNRAYSSISTLSLCVNGDNDYDLVKDIETLAAITNDNDIANQRQKKQQRKGKVSVLDSSLKTISRKNFRILDISTGEML